MSAETLRDAAKDAEESETYTVAQIREAYAKHANRDDWGVQAFYEGGLLNALRGVYDEPVIPDVTA